MSALLTTIRDLHRRKGRERRALAVAEGVRLVEEALAARVVIKGAAVAPALAATPRGAALRKALDAAAVPIEDVTDQELTELADTEHPQGVVVVVVPPAWKLAGIAPAPGRPALVLDGIQDPGNLGTIARTALAFGAAGLVALPGTADLMNPKVLRGSMGALFRLPAVHATDAELGGWLAECRAELWATTLEGEDLRQVRTGAAGVALLLGNEGAGIRPELAAKSLRRVTIPIARGAESLNVAVAAGIFLHEVTRGR